MSMDIHLHDNEKIDRWLKRIIMLAAVIGLITTFWSDADDFVERKITTEDETVIIHDKQMQQQSIATKSDITHIVNVMAEEQRDDAQLDIDVIEVLERRGVATDDDLWKKIELIKFRNKAAGKIKPEPDSNDGHDHGS